MLSRSVMSDSLRPHGLQPARVLCPWGFSRQDYWNGLPYHPPGDLPNPGIEPRFSCIAGGLFYHLSHQESPKLLEWVAYSFSRRSSQPRNWSGVSCVTGGFFTSWATREAYLPQWGSLILEFIVSRLLTAGGEGNGTPLQYSCLENPMDRGARWAAVSGVA